jgi:hypothetical protein
MVSTEVSNYIIYVKSSSIIVEKSLDFLIVVKVLLVKLLSLIFINEIAI